MYGKETYHKMVLNQFLKYGYPKFPRENRGAWFYLKELFENTDVDTDVRLNACSMATSLDAEKALGIFNFLRKNKIIENALDSYTKSNYKIKDFSSRPYFIVHEEHRYKKDGFVKFVNIGTNLENLTFNIDNTIELNIKAHNKDSLLSGEKSTLNFEILETYGKYHGSGRMNYCDLHGNGFSQAFSFDANGACISEE
jgi:hypothetical protein